MLLKLAVLEEVRLLYHLLYHMASTAGYSIQRETQIADILQALRT
jgi:hypothetical protein